MQNHSNTLLIAGLGNPGERYVYTRHNIGFIILDSLAREFCAEWKFKKDISAEITSFTLNKNIFDYMFNVSSSRNDNTIKIPKHITILESTNVILLKPQTFVNNSGLALQACLRYYKFQDFLVVHDELDIPLGAIKFKFGGSSGGHNGLKSIDSLCTNQYPRLRFGIGANTQHYKNLQNTTNNENKVSKIGDFASTADFVLSKFTKNENLTPLIEHSKKALIFFALTRDISGTSQTFGKKF